MMIRSPLVRRQPTSLLDEFLNDEFFLPSLSSSHDIDVYQEGHTYVVEVELAGYQKEDIQISYSNDLLTLKAERNAQKEAENKKYIYRSRTHDRFTRQIRFSNIDGNKIDANYEQGVLKVILPIRGDTDVQHRIEVK